MTEEAVQVVRDIAAMAEILRLRALLRPKTATELIELLIEAMKEKYPEAEL